MSFLGVGSKRQNDVAWRPGARIAFAEESPIKSSPIISEPMGLLLMVWVAAFAAWVWLRLSGAQSI
jgi:hypothetical protein